MLYYSYFYVIYVDVNLSIWPWALHHVTLAPSRAPQKRAPSLRASRKGVFDKIKKEWAWGEVRGETEKKNNSVVYTRRIHNKIGVRCGGERALK